MLHASAKYEATACTFKHAPAVEYDSITAKHLRWFRCGGKAGHSHIVVTRTSSRASRETTNEANNQHSRRSSHFFMDVAQNPVSLEIVASLRLAVPKRSHSGYQKFSLRTFRLNFDTLGASRFRTKPCSLRPLHEGS